VLVSIIASCVTPIASHRARVDVATAAAHFGAAMTLASKLKMRPLVADCHASVGRPYRRAGNQEQAREHLTTARGCTATSA
jgi:hypothetical protein